MTYHAKITPNLLEEVHSALPAATAKPITYRDLRDRLPFGDATIRIAVQQLIAERRAEALRIYGDNGRKRFKRMPEHG